MDGIKKFENFLDRMQGLLDNAKKQGHIIVRVEDLENAFPELAESEDEKVRKTLYEYFKERKNDGDIDETWYGISYDKILTWLEKPSKKISLWKHWKNGIAGNGEGKPIYLVKVGNTYSLTSCLGFECDYIELSELDDLMVEKQCEQKPKFSVGDTIKCKYDDRQFTIKSVDLDKGTYTYTQEGCGNDIDYADEEFELVEQKPTDNQFTTEQASLLDKHIDKLIDQTLPDKYEWSGKIKSRKAKGVLKEMLDEKLKSIKKKKNVKKHSSRSEQSEDEPYYVVFTFPN